MRVRPDLIISPGLRPVYSEFEGVSNTVIVSVEVVSMLQAPCERQAGVVSDFAHFVLDPKNKITYSRHVLIVMLGRR